MQKAFSAAQALWQQFEQVDRQAYTEANEDRAMAHWLLGQVLLVRREAVPALPLLQEAQRCFEALGEHWVRMASVALAAQGDCLQALGQLQAAAAAYEEAIECSNTLEDIRQVAAVKVQLATNRMYQTHYEDALQGFQEALALFQQLEEPGMVAKVWHQIGMTHKAMGEFVQAEQAYRQSLSINSQQGNQAGEASSLGELGNLYDNWQRPEQAVRFYRQAADIYMALGNLRSEGITRNNIAPTLIKLQRYDEARPELLRAIECSESYAHTAQPWKTWDILYDLEQACGHSQAAREARQKALDAFLAYRRDGGENHSVAGRLALAVREAMQQGDTTEMEQVIGALLEHDDWQNDKNFLHKLQAIIAGERDLVLAADEDLSYSLAAELVLLLEALQS